MPARPGRVVRRFVVQFAVGESRFFERWREIGQREIGQVGKDRVAGAEFSTAQHFQQCINPVFCAVFPAADDPEYIFFTLEKIGVGRQFRRRLKSEKAGSRLFSDKNQRFISLHDPLFHRHLAVGDGAQVVLQYLRGPAVGFRRSGREDNRRRLRLEAKGK